MKKLNNILKTFNKTAKSLEDLIIENSKSIAANEQKIKTIEAASSELMSEKAKASTVLKKLKELTGDTPATATKGGK